jgi:hypothetical protein
MKYIIRDSIKPGLAGSIDIGTRHETSDGYMDRWWGNTRDELSLMKALQSLAYRDEISPCELIVFDKRKSAQKELLVVAD